MSVLQSLHEEHKRRRERFFGPAKQRRRVIPSIPETPAIHAASSIPAAPAPVIPEPVRQQFFIPPPPLIPGQDIPTRTIRNIGRVVAHFYDVPFLELAAHRRTKHVVRARQVAFYLCCEMTTMSLPQIGRAFGNKDHTTVLHARNKITRLIKADPVLAGEVERLREHVDASFAPVETDRRAA